MFNMNSKCILYIYLAYIQFLPFKENNHEDHVDKIILQDGGRTFTPEFQDGRLKCFYCPKVLTQLKRHFGTHKDQIQDWDAMEEFCLKVSNMWRKEAVSKAQHKYEKTEKAKEIRNKYEKT